MFRSPIFLWALILPCFWSCEPGPAAKAEKEASFIRKGWEQQEQARQFLSEGKTQEAFTSFSMSRKSYDEAADSTSIAYVLINMAAILKEYNDYIEMQATDVEALSYLNKNSDPRYFVSIYNDFGISYCQLEDYGKAVENYEKAMALTKDPFSLLVLKNNIGYVHISGGNFSKAYSLLRDAYNSPIINDSLEIKARISDNLGYAAFRLKRPESERLLLEGLEIRQKTKETFGAIASCIHLSKSYAATNKEKALYYARMAENLAKENHSPDDRLIALKLLVALADAENAKAYGITYTKIADSLETARQKARNSFADIKYNYKFEREDKLKNRLELAQEKNRRLTWALIAVVLGTAMIFLTIYFIRRGRRIRWKAAYDTEVQLSGRLHDTLANDVHQTMLLAETKDLSVPGHKDLLLDKLEAVYNSIRRISRDNSDIPDSSGFAQGIRDLLANYNSAQTQVLAEGIDLFPWQRLNRRKQIGLYRILQELLANMKKHSDCGHALFRFELNGKKLSLHYSDDGAGKDAPPAKLKNGLRIMENRISELKGNFTFEPIPGKGFRAHVEIPL